MAHSAPVTFAADEMVSFVTGDAVVDTSPRPDFSAAAGILISLGISGVFWIAISYAIRSVLG